MMLGNRPIPQGMITLFWDVDLKQLDLSQHTEFIIERVLNMGNEHDVAWLWKTYKRDEILETVQVSRRLTRKTARCWQNYFDLREDQMRCFSTYSMSPDNFY